MHTFLVVSMLRRLLCKPRLLLIIVLSHIHDMGHLYTKNLLVIKKKFKFNGALVHLFHALPLHNVLF